MGTVAHYLPEWVLYVQAIGTPVLTGAVVGYFAWWQARIAREKLKLDIYDKRFKVFEAFSSLSFSIDYDNKMKSANNLRSVISILPQCYFLFDADMHNYLLKTVRKVEEIQDKCKNIAENKQGITFEAAYVSAMSQEFPVLYKDLLNRFEPYLRVSDLRSRNRLTITVTKKGIRVMVADPFHRE